MYGIDLIKVDVEAFGFTLNSGMTNVPSVQTLIHLEEILPKETLVSLSTSIDIQSMHLILVPSLKISKRYKQLKHHSDKFQFVVVQSTKHILKMELSKFIDFTILKSIKVL